ncbi:deoxyribose-phosphate aldolase [Synechococcus sp. RSCCF101]|uniref:deoxyribose-phosphate aldolase n=1 Tax=Synechococcus sp. RSCCF101 TaxID=2511069 RepID=UPI0012466B0E|nr:deoxyribose-phosphate aldolase [Synechococcus sp. RSCCF101]QEY33189.1 deoxyribose-phosphate aldolase [Synechococcus sp. RSCCF101]
MTTLSSAEEVDLASVLELALLDPLAGRAEVSEACDQARSLSLAAVCVASRNLPHARERLGASGPVRLVGVIAFPFGAVPAEVRWAEAEWAASAGADELDVMPDLAALAEGRSSAFAEDLAAICELGPPVKAILEVGRLDRALLSVAVEAAIDAGVTILKTGSGFGPPARAEDVGLLRQLARGRAGIKASGGITELDQARSLVLAGANRLGTSRAPALIEAQRQEARGGLGR